MVYEDDNVFIYEKPAGWVCASPNPKVKTTYTAVKAYLEAKTEERSTFISSTNCHEKPVVCSWSPSLWHGDNIFKRNWNSFAKGMYVMVQGHLAADDELFLRPENSDPYALPYRTMRATNLHTLLKFKAGYEVIKDMLPALRRDDCLLIGVGNQRQTPSSEEASICLPWH